MRHPFELDPKPVEVDADPKPESWAEKTVEILFWMTTACATAEFAYSVYELVTE